MSKKKIEFYKHNINQTDINNAVKTLNSLFLTTGKQVDQFEKQFAEYLDTEYAVGVTSCTEALFLSLKYLNIKPGDEVITTPLSFIASANSVEFCGAKPVFVDVEESTGNINADLIEAAITNKTKAILLVHLYGHMCDMIKIKKIAKKHKLKIIEDAAHCIEGERDNNQVGQVGDLACFSFYAVKNITSGEGGMISCHSSKAETWLKKARLHGMSKGAADRYGKKYIHWDMEFLGYKANMNNIQASLLTSQLKRIETFLRKKEQIASKYDKGFKNNPNVRTPKTLSNTKHARHLYTIWVNPKKRDNLLQQIQDKSIGVAVNFRPIHLTKYYKNKYKYKKGDFPVTEKIGSSTISLPFYPKLTTREVNYVIDTVNSLTNY